LEWLRLSAATAVPTCARRPVQVSYWLTSASSSLPRGGPFRMTSTKQLVRVGHSPDPDDAFMFYALAKGKIDTEGLEFVHELVDIETLNQRAFSGELELTAVSLHAYAYLQDKYVLCHCGARMGDGYGPMVVV